MSVLPTPAVTDFGSLASLKAQARANDPQSVRKAAEQFEALFVQQMLKSARAANLGDDILGGGQTEFYQDMFDQQMALHLSSGKGMGLADLLAKQMLGADKTPASDEMAALSSYRPVTALAREVAQSRRASAITSESAPAASATAPPADFVPSTGPQAFIDQIRPHAERAAAKLGVPAEAIMAQAALETGWGKHVPRHADGTPSHNYFGIKAHGGWRGDRLEKTTHEHLGGRMQKVSAEFRSYGSVGEAFDDYARFLQSNPRYADALRRGSDAAGFAQGLQEAGYATDPAYANKLLKLMGSASINRAGDASQEVSA